jgi:hypothetical protein
MSKFTLIVFSSLVALSLHAQTELDTSDVTPYPFESRGLVNEQARTSWDALHRYHPAVHRPDNFIYIITEIEAPALNRYTLPIIQNPQMISENMRICASVIGRYGVSTRKKNEEFYGTFRGRIALILNVPSENIGPMHTSDMASGDTSWHPDLKNRYEEGLNVFRMLMEFGNFGKKFNYLYRPADFLESTRQSGSSYNEVAVLGTNFSRTRFNLNGVLNYSKVRVDGFYIECGSKSSKNELKDLFGEHVVVKLDSDLNDPEKKEILETCLQDSKERVDPKNEILDTLVSQNKDGLYSIILSKRTRN